MLRRTRLGSMYSLTQLYDGRDMYRHLLHKEQLHVSSFTLVIIRLRILVSSYTRVMWVVYNGEVRGEVGTRSRMCYIGWAVWVQGVLLLYAILG